MAIKKLKDMKPGESGLIVALHGSGNVKHRLIDICLTISQGRSNTLVTMPALR